MKLTLMKDNLENDVLEKANDVINEVNKEDSVYSGFSNRLLLSNFLYLIKEDNDIFGFISSAKDDKFYNDIITLDLVLYKKYRGHGYGIRAINDVLKDIKEDKNYKNEFIILEKNKTNDGYSSDWIDLGNNVLLLEENRLNELRKTHPNGIFVGNKIMNSREVFSCVKKR